MSDRVKIVLVVVVILLVLASTNGAQYYFNNKSITELETYYEEQKQEMQDFLTSLGDIVTVYKVRNPEGVSAGRYITDSDLIETDVPESLITADTVRDKSKLSGLKWRTDQAYDTLVGYSMVRKNEYDNTSRPWVISLDAYPVSMAIGDYIDVYLVMPRGEPLLAFSQLEVRDILDGKLIVWFNLTEQLMYSGLVQDSERYREYGGHLMGVKYVDQGVQAKPATFYVPPVNVALHMDMNPNMIDSPKMNSLRVAREAQERLFDVSTIDENMLPIFKAAGERMKKDLDEAYQAWLKRYEEQVSQGLIPAAPIQPDTGGFMDMTNPPLPEEPTEPGLNEDGGSPLNNGAEPEILEEGAEE